MNVVIWSLGTRGDVLPYRRLADELARRGDSVTLVVPSGLRHLVDSSPHHVYDAGVDPSALLASEHPFALGGAPTLVEQLRATRAYLRAARAVYRRLVRVSLREPLRSADLHVVTLASIWLLQVLHQLKRGRTVAAFVQPVSFSARYASVLLPHSLRSSCLPRSVGHRVADLAIWLPWRFSVQHAARSRLPVAGPLTLLHRYRIPVVYGFSRYLARAYLTPVYHHVTGSWSGGAARRQAATDEAPRDDAPHASEAPDDLALAASLPEALQEFLARHDRVVLITFGSQSRIYRRLLIELMDLSRPTVPLVIQTHGSIARASGSPDPKRLVLDGSEGAVDHGAVLPRCSAVVHHGGAGTLHTVTRHGVPSVVVPAAADTYFWAEAAQSAGIAPLWRNLRHATARSVIAAACSARAEPFVSRALEIAGRMRSEKGARLAARLIHDSV